MKTWLLAGILTLCSSMGYAQNLERMAPGDVVKTAVEGVMTTVESDPASQTGDVTALTHIVERKFIPFTNFERTTRLAVGSAWNTASTEQQKELFEQFQTLLTRVYAVELTQIISQHVKFTYRPVTLAAGASDVVVRTHMLNNGEDDEIDYRLEKTSKGWRIYDINILGAWLSQLYRHQFAEPLARGGPAALIRSLARHNAH